MKRWLLGLVAAVAIAAGLGGAPQANVSEGELLGSPPEIECQRECTWTHG